MTVNSRTPEGLIVHAEGYWEIPLTFILVALLYLGEQVYGLLKQDNVSQLAHILGGLVGAVYGFIWKDRQVSR